MCISEHTLFAFMDLNQKFETNFLAIPPPPPTYLRLEGEAGEQG